MAAVFYYSNKDEICGSAEYCCAHFNCRPPIESNNAGRYVWLMLWIALDVIRAAMSFWIASAKGLTAVSVLSGMFAAALAIYHVLELIFNFLEVSFDNEGERS